MIYSVYNYGTQSYDYYVGGPASSSAHAPVPRRASGTSTLGPRGRGMGATPEEAAWKLPPGSRKIGSGYEARGLIATGEIVSDAISGLEIVGIGLLAFTLYKVLG